MDAMEFCVQTGYISGRDNKLRPKEALTRAEAIILMNQI